MWVQGTAKGEGRSDGLLSAMCELAHSNTPRYDSAVSGAQRGAHIHLRQIIGATKSWRKTQGGSTHTCQRRAPHHTHSGTKHTTHTQHSVLVSKQTFFWVLVHVYELSRSHRYHWTSTSGSRGVQEERALRGAAKCNERACAPPLTVIRLGYV